MKRFISISLLIILLFFSLVSFLSFRFLPPFIIKHCSPSPTTISSCLASLKKLSPLIHRIPPLQSYSDTLDTVLSFEPFIPYLLGTNDKPTNYMVLLQNDAEMRANGGFVGSYAVINLSYPTLETKFEDIYVPSGKLRDLKLYVKPPEPVQIAFGNGSWYLPDADFDPDFPTAANSIRFFMDKGGETNPDILTTLPLSVIRQIIDLAGPFSVLDLKATLTPDNFYLFLQSRVETNFFPGSTMKRDTLTSVGDAFIDHLLSLPPTKLLDIANILHTALKSNQIKFHSLNPDFQTFLINHKFAGAFPTPLETDFHMVDINLGANKANAYVKKEIIKKSHTENGKPITDISITFTNSSPESNPLPPYYFGGDYLSYVRLYIPKDSNIINFQNSSSLTSSMHTSNGAGSSSKNLYLPSAESNSESAQQAPHNTIISLASTSTYSAKPYHDWTEIGFWHTVKHNSSSQILLQLQTP